MADLLLMEAANLFIGDENPEAGKHLKITNLTLPTLEFDSVDHRGGGASMEVGWGMNVIKKLEMSFKLAGFDEEAYAAAGIGSNAPRTFTARGMLRRKSDGKGFNAVATVKACMGKIAPDGFDRSNVFGHDHSLVEITRYRLIVGDVEWFYVDYFTTERRRFGVDELAEYRNFLGVS